MKILHVNDVANVAGGLVEALKKIGYNAQLYQPCTGTARPGRLSKLSVAAYRIQDIHALAKRVHTEKFDIVHIHYAYFGTFGVLGGYPYWLHCHGTDIRRNLYHPAYKHITRLSLARANKVLYSTPDLKIHAERLRPDATFLPNPIQTDMFKPVNFDGTEAKILLMSRIDRIKGIDIAFRALERIKKRNPSVSISAFLWGPDLAEFRQRSFVGFIPMARHDEVAALISNYQIIIGQFELGILGMSEMEAMACARPVICHFNYRDWYSEAPPIVEAQNEDEIVSRVEVLLGDRKLCEELGAAGRDWVKKYHGYIAVAERLAGMYEATARSYPQQHRRSHVRR